MTPSKFLCISLKHLGDVVTVTAVLPILKDNFPDSEIHFLANPASAPLVKHHKLVDEVIVSDRKAGFGENLKLLRKLRKEKYDYVLDYSEGDRGAMWSFLSGGEAKLGYASKRSHLFRNLVPHYLLPDRSMVVERPVTFCHADFARAIGCVFQEVPDPSLFTTGEGREAAAKFLKENSVSGPYAAVHFTAIDAIRLWPAKHCAEAIDFLSETVGPVLIFTSSSDEERSFIGEILKSAKGNAILAAALDLDTVMGLLENAKIFIGLDSLVGHMAAALKVPTVGIFGPSREKHWAPRGPAVRVAHVDKPCRSCVSGGCLGNNLSACLEELSFGKYVRPLVEELLALNLRP
jgi:ADP-heptose:LPS heptosyltransferase